MPGSASGLRVTACIVAPDSASAAPTRIASTVRGSARDDGGLARRRRQSPSSAARISSMLTSRAPNATDATHSSASTQRRRPRATPDAPPPGAAWWRRSGGGVRVRVSAHSLSVECAGEEREVVVDAPADRQRRRVGGCRERGRVLEDRDRVRCAIAGICDSSGSACICVDDRAVGLAVGDEDVDVGEAVGLLGADR